VSLLSPVSDPAVDGAHAPPPQGEARTSRAGLLLDGFERLAVLGLYLWLVFRLVVAFRSSGRLIYVFLMVSEGLVVLFLLLRRNSHSISRRPLDWLLAVGATCAPMLVTPGGGSGLVPPIFAAVTLLIGLFVQVHAKIALGRSFGCVAAHRGLKFGGPYQFVRHPMYLGYLLCHVGFLLSNPSGWNLLMYALGDLLQVPRLLAEERLLSGDPDYQAYQRNVPYRLLPGLF